MAKVNVQFDTVDKSFAVDIDGKQLENVQSVQIFPSYADEDDACIAIGMMEEQDEAGIITFTRICAKQSKDGKLAHAVEIPDATDFVVIREEKVTAPAKQEPEQATAAVAQEQAKAALRSEIAEYLKRD